MPMRQSGLCNDYGYHNVKFKHQNIFEGIFASELFNEYTHLPANAVIIDTYDMSLIQEVLDFLEHNYRTDAFRHILYNMPPLANHVKPETCIFNCESDQCELIHEMIKQHVDNFDGSNYRLDDILTSIQNVQCQDNRIVEAITDDLIKFHRNNANNVFDDLIAQRADIHPEKLHDAIVNEICTHVNATELDTLVSQHNTLRKWITSHFFS
jgi:hypothetical protein